MLCVVPHTYIYIYQCSKCPSIPFKNIWGIVRKQNFTQNFNLIVDAARPPYQPTPIYWPKFLLKNELSINMNITSNLETLSKTNKTTKTYIICNKLELKPSFSTQAIKYFPHFKNLSLWWAKNCFINLFFIIAQWKWSLSSRISISKNIANFKALTKWYFQILLHGNMNTHRVLPKRCIFIIQVLI